MQTLTLTANRLFYGTGTAGLVRPTVRIAGNRIQAVDSAPLPDDEQALANASWPKASTFSR